MPSSVECEIHDQLRRYLAGDLSLAAFTDWFIPVMWEAEEGIDPVLGDLAGTIDLYLIERSMGHRSEEELKAALTPLVVNRPRPNVQSRASVQYLRMTIEPQIRSVTEAIRGRASNSQTVLRTPHAGAFG